MTHTDVDIVSLRSDNKTENNEETNNRLRIMDVGLDNNILNTEFDVFIAYHGTDSINGSMAKAREIYLMLKANGLNCFFFPDTNPSGAFSDTPTVATHSRLFLLVANNAIPVNERNELTNPGLFNEVKSFYNKNFNEINSAGSARVYAYDGLTPDKANNFHVVFNGAAHFVESSGTAKDMLISWALTAANKGKGSGYAQPLQTVSMPTISRGNILRTPRFLEGIWTLSGVFSQFQGDSKRHYVSSGRLVLLWNVSLYKAVYCYSVSVEYARQAKVTTLCEGSASFTSSTDDTLTITCDIISRTSPKRANNSNRQFQLFLKPTFNDDNTVNTMTASFKTKNTDGTLTFTKHI